MKGAQKKPARQRRLSRDDWIVAGVKMLERVQLDRLEISPLAAELGATKGSFYWHFSHRAELIEAIAVSWEREATTRIIDEAEEAPADERVSRLLHVAFGSSEEARSEWGILSSTNVPAVVRIVERVHGQRIDYLGKLFRSQGLSVERADARARILYATYLGHLQVAAGYGGVIAPARWAGARLALLAELRTLALAP